MSEPLVYSKFGGDDMFSDALEVDDGVSFAVCIEGDFVGTITLQIATRWRDVTGGWVDDETYTEPSLDMSWRSKGRVLVRAGFKSGDYTSGEAIVQIYRGEDDAQYAVTKKVP